MDCGQVLDQHIASSARIAESSLISDLAVMTYSFVRGKFPCVAFTIRYTRGRAGRSSESGGGGQKGGAGVPPADRNADRDNDHSIKTTERAPK